MVPCHTPILSNGARGAEGRSHLCEYVHMFHPERSLFLVFVFSISPRDSTVTIVLDQSLPSNGIRERRRHLSGYRKTPKISERRQVSKHRKNGSDVGPKLVVHRFSRHVTSRGTPFGVARRWKVPYRSMIWMFHRHRPSCAGQRDALLLRPTLVARGMHHRVTKSWTRRDFRSSLHRDSARGTCEEPVRNL
mmetsp:Transcript_15410/g.34558  ORF Transcript_15410/g.34558 Transcript_15410/m.34558 type:complete len:191 (-) Transcript_15410:339-911(-)